MMVVFPQPLAPRMTWGGPRTRGGGSPGVRVGPNPDRPLRTVTGLKNLMSSSWSGAKHLMPWIESLSMEVIGAGAHTRRWR